MLRVHPGGGGMRENVYFHFLTHKYTFKWFEHRKFHQFPKPWWNIQVLQKIQQKFRREIKLFGIYRDVFGYILGFNPDRLRRQLALCFYILLILILWLVIFFLWHRGGEGGRIKGCLFWNRDLRKLLQTVTEVEVNFMQRLGLFYFLVTKENGFWVA